MPTRRTRKTRRPVTRRSASRKVARQWSREECAFMRKYYRRFETSWIARQLGRTVYSVRYKAVDLSLKKANPSVWQGNKGPKNAFRKPAKRRTSKPTTRRTKARRSTTRRTYRATAKRRTARKASPRRTRRTKK